MGCFKMNYEQQQYFAAYPETFPDAQFAYLKTENFQSYCVVVGCRVAVTLDRTLQTDLDRYIDTVWRGVQLGPKESLIEKWIKNLDPAIEVWPVDASRADLYAVITNPNPPFPPPPPPPPVRPTVVPAAPGGRGALPTTYGHLPFQTKTTDYEVFYRWEAFPSSRRIAQNNRDDGQPRILPWTFASPSSEVPFIPTGFSAVGRNALPSFFPAVFRWEIQPSPGTHILCGAVVLMYGQSGGGVEVCFSLGANTRSPIANPVVIEPL